MKSEKNKLLEAKNAIETALEIEDMSLSTRIEEYCIARQLFVVIVFKRISIRHDLIMTTIGRSRPNFYNTLYCGRNTIDINSTYRGLFESILTELNFKK